MSSANLSLNFFVAHHEFVDFGLELIVDSGNFAVDHRHSDQADQKSEDAQTDRRVSGDTG
jgi:hypothetical protein